MRKQFASDEVSLVMMEPTVNDRLKLQLPLDFTELYGDFQPLVHQVTAPVHSHGSHAVVSGHSRQMFSQRNICKIATVKPPAQQPTDRRTEPGFPSGAGGGEQKRS